jgi:excisionase family DNA binding protein
MKEQDRTEIWTLEEAARWLRLTVKTVRLLCAEGRIPGAVKLGKAWRLSRAGLEALFSVDGPAPSPTPHSDPQPTHGRTRNAGRRTRHAATDRAETLRLLQALPEAEP